MAGIASLAVAGVAFAGYSAAGGAAADTPVAGGGAPLGGPEAPATTPAVVAAPAPKARQDWTPGGPIGARPIGVIPRAGAVEIGDRYRFETLGTRWCISEWEADAKEWFEPFGCRGTVGNANIGDGRSPGLQSSGTATGDKVVTSVFRGEPRRVIYTDGGKYYEAKVYRLAGIPGWSMSVAHYKAPASEKPNGDSAVFTYGAGDKLLVQFPEPKDGGPKTDPLHQR